MTTIISGCTADRANEILAQLDRRGVAVMDPQERVQIVGTFTVRNLGPGDVPRGALVYRGSGKLTVKDSSGRILATLKPRQTAAVALKPRRKLRRIGGSDRLWRALRGLL